MTVNHKVSFFLSLLFLVFCVNSCVTKKEAPISPIPSIPDYIKTVTNPSSGYEKDLDPVFLRSFNNAWGKLQGGKAAEAEGILEDIINSKPNFYPAYVGIAYIEMMDESYNKAMRNLGIS